MGYNWYYTPFFTWKISNLEDKDKCFNYPCKFATVVALNAGTGGYVLLNC